VGQRISFPVTAGQTYTLTKYVGVEDSNTATDPVNAAASDAAGAAGAGFAGLLPENNAAWAKLWQGRIDVSGNRTVATDVNASQF
jgi:trehalose/maltose hydrolase-like predicted phosphorylase